MPVAPPAHKEIRLDAVVNNTISQQASRQSEPKSLQPRDLNYNAKMGEQRILQASERRDQAEHLLQQAKENFTEIEKEQAAYLDQNAEKPVMLSAQTARFIKE